MDLVSVDGSSASDSITTETSRSLSGGIGRSRIAFDLAVLLVAPAVLVAVWIVPETVRRAWVFSYSDPTLLTAFTAHYVHLTASHLFANLLGFLLLGSVAYGLSVVAGQRRLFAMAAVTFLVAFPFVLSALNLAVPRNAIGYGFSGVNMAFFGYIVVILPDVLDGLTDTNVHRYTPALFLLSVGYIALIALPISTVSLLLAVTAATAALPYCRTTRGTTAQGLLDATWHLLKRPGVGELLAVAVVVLVAYPFVGFPSQSPTGVAINLYVHFLGYALAFLVVHVSLLLDATGIE